MKDVQCKFCKRILPDNAMHQCLLTEVQDRIVELESAARDHDIAADEYRATRERIAELEAENERLDDHAKKWGIKAQRAEQQLAEAQAELEPCRAYQKEGESLAECLERNRRDAGRALRLFAEAKDDAERYREWCKLTYEGKSLRVELPRAADQIETFNAIDAAIDTARVSDGNTN